MKLSIVLAVALIFGLCACGQKGDLYLPQSSTQASTTLAHSHLSDQPNQSSQSIPIQ